MYTHQPACPPAAAAARQAATATLAQPVMEPAPAAADGAGRKPVKRHAGRRRRFGTQLWTLLHAQALLDGPATAAGRTRLIEDGNRRFTAFTCR